MSELGLGRLTGPLSPSKWSRSSAEFFLLRDESRRWRHRSVMTSSTRQIMTGNEPSPEISGLVSWRSADRPFSEKIYTFLRYANPGGWQFKNRLWISCSSPEKPSSKIYRLKNWPKVGSEISTYAVFWWWCETKVSCNDNIFMNFFFQTFFGSRRNKKSDSKSQIEKEK